MKPPVVELQRGFMVTGKLGVRGIEDAFSTNFSWRHGYEFFEIELWGPLGQGRTRLAGSADGVTVYTPNGEVIEEPSSEAAMQRFLGFAIPVDVLAYWAQGEHAPDYPYGNVVERADELTFDQLGWSLRFSRFKNIDGRRLPGRVAAERAPIRVTIVPRDWRFSTPDQ